MAIILIPAALFPGARAIADQRRRPDVLDMRLGRLALFPGDQCRPKPQAVALAAELIERELAPFEPEPRFPRTLDLALCTTGA